VGKGAAPALVFPVAGAVLGGLTRFLQAMTEALTRALHTLTPARQAGEGSRKRSSKARGPTLEELYEL